MNKWTKISIELASKNNYLDQLFDVYPTIQDKKRKINTYEQYVYALTCATRCHQCILWMTRAHSYTRCESFFFMRRFTQTKRRNGRGSRHGHDFGQKSNAGAHPSTSSWIVRLLPPAPAWLSRRQKRRSKACARKHARGHHPIVDTQRHDPGTRCDQSRKKGWYVKCIKMYALTMVMYTWHWQTSQVQIHRHSGDQGSNLSIIGTFSYKNIRFLYRWK